MKAVARDLAGYAAVAQGALRRMGLLAHRPYRRRFLEVFVDTARMALGDIGLRSAGLGTLIIAGITSLVAADPGTAVRVLVVVVMREVGPLVAALIVLIRVGLVMSARLGLSEVSGQARQLRLQGIDPAHYLVVPAVPAIALATLVLTFYFQLLAVGGGLVLSALLMDLSVRQLGEHLLMTVTPLDVAYTMLKSLAFGLIIASVCAYHGSTRAAGPELPQTLSRAVMQSLFVMTLFNAAFGYLVYGVLLFGIVRAPY